MRRKDRKLDSADTLDILKNGEYGVLATVTEDGQKTDNLRLHPEVCFTIIR